MSTRTLTSEHLGIKDAVKKAVTAFESVFPEEATRDLRLEEIALNEKETEWLTTISYKKKDNVEIVEATHSQNALSNLLGLNKARVYKIIRLRAADGKLIGIVNAG